jgi:hypothetical protein
VAVATEFALQRLAAANSTDEQRRRSAATRLAILQRLIQVGIIVVGAALFLMQFSGCPYDWGFAAGLGRSSWVLWSVLPPRRR